MSAKKIVSVPGIGEVTLTKRRGNTNIRLSYTRAGEIRVSLPYFVPYQAGISFVKTKTDWLQKHRPEPIVQLEDGDRIGKAHQIQIIKSSTANKPTVRVTQLKIKVTVPVHSSISEEAVQEVLQRGALRALKQEAQRLLPQRLDQLARQHSFSYASLNTKRLTSRWGSCSQHADIILNTYLMQLPWHLIDYVIVHELVHTEHLNHSADFWQRFEEIMPNAKQLRRELKQYPTAIQPKR